MRYAILTAVLLTGCSSSPTAPSATATPSTSQAIAPGVFRSQINDVLTAELILREGDRSSFSVKEAANRLCIDGGVGSTAPAIVFTPSQAVGACYTRSAGDTYLRLCLITPDRVEGSFWLHPATNFGQPHCIHGPQPPPTGSTQGGSFAFVMTRQ